MANLVYQGTVDERVYDRLSERMKDRYDLLGSLPDVIKDDWIEDIEILEAALKDYTKRKKVTADVFELRYGNFLDLNGAEWQLSARRCWIKTKRSGFLAMAGKIQLSI
jgi:hypothetical protein